MIFFNDTATTEIYTLSLHDALPILRPDVQRLLGASEDMGKMLGLDKQWSYRIVKQVGNYGESFEANLGPNSKVGLPRGNNNLWTKGGLLYAPPIR